MGTQGTAIKDLTQTAKAYYETDTVHNFYRQVWGEEYIHLGLYDELGEEHAELDDVSRVAKASELATDECLRRCFPPGCPPPEACTLADFGSGVGGTARRAAKQYGCKVICINISANQNAVNAQMCEAEGLTDKVTIPGERSYFDTGLPAESVDVVSAQDSLLHAGLEQHRVLAEAARVLKPGGLFVMVDVMLAEDVPEQDKERALRRMNLQSLGTFTSYKEQGEDCGFVMLDYTDRTRDLVTHYKTLHRILAAGRGTMTGIDDDFWETYKEGVVVWNGLASRDLMRWGFFVFMKRASPP